MEIAKFRGAITPKPLNRLTKNLARVITSAMTPRVPKLKTNTLLGALRCMREITLAWFLVFRSYPILFVTPNFAPVPRLNRRIDF